MIKYIFTGDLVRVANSAGGWTSNMAGDTTKLMTYFSITLLHADDWFSGGNTSKPITFFSITLLHADD